MNAGHILTENKQGAFTEKTRRQLIRHVTEYQLSRFGKNTTIEQKESVAVATGMLFPSLSAVSNK